MILDNNLTFSASQDLESASDETVLATYSIDLGATKDYAKGRQMYVVIEVEEDFAGGTSVDVQVVTDSAAALTTSVVIGCSTGAIAIASLTNDRPLIVLPVGNALSQTDQYLGIQYVVVGTMTAGIVSAWLAFDTP